VSTKQQILLIIVLIIAVAGSIVWWDNRFGPSAATPTPREAEQPLINSLSDGVITFRYTSEWALAIKPEQILINTPTPLCDEGFAYCLYYHGAAGESPSAYAALSITRRSELATAAECLAAPREGAVYRLSHQATCYEVETRLVGESAYLQAELARLLKSFTLASGGPINFE
jgi:hypothetical protein